MAPTKLRDRERVLSRSGVDQLGDVRSTAHQLGADFFHLDWLSSSSSEHEGEYAPARRLPKGTVMHGK
jgi:hypothetical protein